MATEDNRIVHHTIGSRYDLISIYQYNEAVYGIRHAEKYLDFLDAQMSLLALDPTIGSIVEQYPDIKVYLAKIKPHRKINGHRIFYREVADGIEIIRVLHTSMEWSDYFE